MTELEQQSTVLEVIRGQEDLTASNIANRARITERDAVKMIRKLRCITLIEEHPIGSETYRIPSPIDSL